MCSLVSRAPLTETLLKHKPANLPKISSFNDSSCRKEDETTNRNLQGEISMKLAVSKSKNTVFYAVADKEFVNLLLTFLTIPIGHLVKQKMMVFL